MKSLLTSLRLILALAVVAIGLTAATSAASPASAAPTGRTIHGCPVGYFCIYPQNAGWNSDRPSHKFYNYGRYNLSNQYGTHRMVNNQYGSTLVGTCRGYNATNGYQNLFYYQGQVIDANLTPINSIHLWSPTRDGNLLCGAALPSAGGGRGPIAQ